MIAVEEVVLVIDSSDSSCRTIALAEFKVLAVVVVVEEIIVVDLIIGLTDVVV